MRKREDQELHSSFLHDEAFSVCVATVIKQETDCSLLCEADQLQGRHIHFPAAPVLSFFLLAF